MRRTRGWKSAHPWLYGSPTVIGVAIAVAAIAMAMAIGLIYQFLLSFIPYMKTDFRYLVYGSYFFLGVAVCVIFATVREKRTRTDMDEMGIRISQRLFQARYGNPLCLRDGDILPRMTLSRCLGIYKLRIYCSSMTIATLSAMDQVISDCLTDRLAAYAVTRKEEDLAGTFIDFTIENVIEKNSKQRIIKSEHDLISGCNAHRLPIRDDMIIDYSTVPNGSAIVAGRTRSGKTTGIILTILLPLLMMGRDEYGSRIVIVDPKSAELSMCPHVLSPTLDGDVHHIMTAIKEFNDLRIQRQQILNEQSQECGYPLKWWDADMHPSILFLDEYIALQGLLPKKASKDDPEYCIDEFKSLIKQVATQGASAGCYLILSTAEASVGAGGLEAIVNHSCGIRVLFKPTKAEAAYLWTPEDLETLHDRSYGPGDAWISIDDGVHSHVSFVRFPLPEVGEYHLLAEWLQRYYGE